MKTRYMIIIIILVISASFLNPLNAETEASYQLIRELTSEEMKMPVVKADVNFSLPGSITVDLPSPMEKLEIKWVKKYNLHTNDKFVTDGLGRTWHSYVEDTMFGSSTMTCLNPDGSIAFEKTSEIGETCPVVVCNGAIIFYTEPTRTFGADEEEYIPGISYYCLESRDLDGELVWRSEKVRARGFYKRVWRISNNRLIMAVGEENSGMFNIYSLKNGKLLEQVVFPNWYAGTIEINPIELADGGWIGYQKLAILRFNRDLEIIWKYDIECKSPDLRTKFMTDQPVLSKDNVLLVHTIGNLVALDLKTGKDLWKRNAHAQPYGITDSGHFIVSGGFLPDITMDDIRSMETYEEIEAAVQQETKIVAIDTSGNEIWSIPNQRFGSGDTSEIIVFQDENILIGTETNLLLLSSIGSIIWSLDIIDFGIDDSSYGLEWNLKPVPNNGVILTLCRSSTFMGPFIFSLGPVD